MSDTITSPNMSLPVPIVSQDPGPDWANNYNACLSIIDQHNHTSGSGVLLSQDSLNLTPAATSFNSLSFNNSNAFALRSVRFTAQSSALALVTDIGCLYEAGVDLYYNDGSGNQIRLTQGGSIVGTSGSITGLPSGTASAAYSGGTFIWQSATNTAANMDAGSYIYRNATASSKGLTLAPPNAMAADYGLVLPALPGVTSIMALDTSGNITAPYTVDNSTIAITANVIGVKTGGITTTQISATAGITGTQMASNNNLPGKATQVASQDIVVSANPATNGLMIVRGTIDSSGSGSIVRGEGFSITRNGTGDLSINFTAAFNSTPSVVATFAISLSNGGILPSIGVNHVSSSTVRVFLLEMPSGGGATIRFDTVFSFIAIGERA